MSSWTFADVWEAIAAAQPDHPAHIQGERVLTWGEFDARADALAAHLIGAASHGLSGVLTVEQKSRDRTSKRKLGPPPPTTLTVR